MKKVRTVATNEGIQGDVRADVLAVGRHARASKVTNAAPDLEALEAALKEMRAAVAELALPKNAHETLERDVGQLEQAVKSPQPDKDRIGGILTGVVGKLKMVGVALGSGVGIGESIRKIAGLVHISLQALGIAP